jgi:hypothetical protein
MRYKWPVEIQSERGTRQKSPGLAHGSRIEPIFEVNLEALKHLFFNVFDVGELTPTSYIAVFRGASISTMNSSTNPSWSRYFSRRCYLQLSAVCFCRFLVPNPIGNESVLLLQMTTSQTHDLLDAVKQAADRGGNFPKCQNSAQTFAKLTLLPQKTISPAVHLLPFGVVKEHLHLCIRSSDTEKLPFEVSLKEGRCHLRQKERTAVGVYLHFGPRSSHESFCSHLTQRNFIVI